MLRQHECEFTRGKGFCLRMLQHGRCMSEPDDTSRCGVEKQGVNAMEAQLDISSKKTCVGLQISSSLVFSEREGHGMQLQTTAFLATTSSIIRCACADTTVLPRGHHQRLCPDRYSARLLVAGGRSRQKTARRRSKFCIVHGGWHCSYGLCRLSLSLYRHRVDFDVRLLPVRSMPVRCECVGVLSHAFRSPIKLSSLERKRKHVRGRGPDFGAHRYGLLYST
jgi:hypothetical protein